eukprot:UN27788
MTAKYGLESENFIQQNTQPISILTSIFLLLRDLSCNSSSFYTLLFQGFLVLCWASSASHLIFVFYPI